jgi:hypothetical protein
MPRIQLFGDSQKTAAWIGWAKTKLRAVKQLNALSQLSSWRKTYKFAEGITVELKSFHGDEQIRIWMVGEEGPLIVCHVGDDTGINGYTKKFYRLKEDSLEELNYTLSDKTYSAGGFTLLDDGKYFLNYDLTTYDDPDSYAYNFNPTGLVTETGSGTAIKAVNNKSGRFVLNQTFEQEFWYAFSVSAAGGGEFDYLVLDDSLLYRPYKIVGNPTFNRYTDDSIVYMAVRTYHTPPSLVLRIESYADGNSDNYGDSLLVINKVWTKKLEDGSKTSKTINNDADGAAVFGATKYYRNKQADQDVGRVKTFDVASLFSMSEWAVKESYGAGTVVDAFKRNADGTEDGQFMKGKTVYGSDLDPSFHVKMPPNFPGVANDVKLPYAFTDDGKLTYVRMVKSSGYTTLNTGLYVADQLIEESGNQSVLTYADGTGGVQDVTTGRWMAEQNGPITIKQTSYTIFHAHHDENFDAVLYKKTVYKSDSVEMLPYKQRNFYGDQNTTIDGQIKQTKVVVEARYYIAVNGTVTQLSDSSGTPYGYTATENYLTSETVTDTDPTHPLLSGPNDRFGDLPWVDIADGGNTQITRVFTTSTDDKILFSFDIWDCKSRHNLVYDTSGGNKNLWPDLDTTLTPFPPLVDTEDIQDRKWLLFDKNSDVKEITPPKNEAGENYRRINGILMVGA